MYKTFFAGFAFLLAAALLFVACGAAGPGVNLALNKHAVASSFEKATNHNGGEDLVPGRVCDGNTFTKWGSDFRNSADPNTAWIYVDLGVKKQLHSVHIYWEAAFAKRFSIEVSDDAIAWKEIAGEGMTPPEFRENDGLSEVVFDQPVEARYVKINGKERGSKWGYAIYELEVY